MDSIYSSLPAPVDTWTHTYIVIVRLLKMSDLAGLSFRSVLLKSSVMESSDHCHDLSGTNVGKISKQMLLILVNLIILGETSCVDLMLVWLLFLVLVLYLWCDDVFFLVQVSKHPQHL